MYLNKRFYYLITVIILVIALGYAVQPLFTIGRFLLLLLVIAVITDIALLWSRIGINAFRTLSPRFSNGDDNPVSIRLESNYPFAVHAEVIDEVPFVFQRRDILFKALIRSLGEATITYNLRPTERGIYGFGRVRVFVSTVLGLVQRRYTCCEPQDVKVYPSYLMLRQYELLAMSNNLTEMGIKRIRRIGHNTDFEQIKDYVVGDDYRTINWRATARRSYISSLTPHLMVNVYQEERAQQVFSVIDKGRMMQQAFLVHNSQFIVHSSSTGEEADENRMTLLDYAINASLVLSYVAVNKQDKAGLITFSDHFETFIPASRHTGQMQTLQEALYAEHTQFGETDYSALLAGLSRHVTHRALLILFTSFTSMAALRRQLLYLRQLARRHRLLVVFFEDEEVRRFTVHSSQFTVHSSQFTVHSSQFTVHSSQLTTEQVYQRVIAEKFVYEQRLIVQTLRQYGIQSLLTTPNNLSIDVINKYLEIKSQHG